jgi:hypothetical protein
VARVSYWSLQENDSAIACELLYLRDSESVDEQFKGNRLAASDCPAYFAALTSKRRVVADHALTYPATSGLGKTYLQLLGISSMLDAPVWVGGAKLLAFFVTNIPVPPGSGPQKRSTSFRRLQPWLRWRWKNRVERSRSISCARAKNASARGVSHQPGEYHHRALE